MNSKVIEERTINFRDVFAEIVQKLGIIILVAALCAVIFPTYKYVRDLKNTNIVTELTDEEKQQVETYLSKQSAYENMEEYVDKSDFMKLNPYNTVQEILTYRVDGIDSTTDVNGIVKVFKDWINGGGIEAIDDDLISCDDYITKNYVITENGMNVFTVTIWAADTSEIVEMKQNAESGIEEFATKLQDTYNFNLTKTNEVKSNIYSTEVESRQRSVMTNLNTAKAELDSLYGSFTDGQKNAIENDNINDVVDNTNKASISVKYVVFGFVLGFVLTIFLVIIVYVMKGKLIADDSIWEKLNVTNLGRVVSEDKIGMFKNWSNRIRGIDATSDENLDIISSRIYKKAYKNNELIIVGQKENNNNNWLDLITDKVAKKDFVITKSESIINDLAILTGQHVDNQVIMLVYPYEQTYQKALKEIYEAGQYGFNIIGIVEVIR